MIRQSPVEGSKYKKGDTVTIYVSAGRDDKMVPVPNLLGKTEEEAKAALLDSGLTWGQISTVESSRAKGTVAAQSIREGVEVKEKTSIDLRISSGPKTATQAPAPTDAPATAKPTQAPATQAPATEKPTIKPVAPNA